MIKEKLDCSWPICPGCRFEDKSQLVLGNVGQAKILCCKECGMFYVVIIESLTYRDSAFANPRIISTLKNHYLNIEDIVIGFKQQLNMEE